MSEDYERLTMVADDLDAANVRIAELETQVKVLADAADRWHEQADRSNARADRALAREDEAIARAEKKMTIEKLTDDERLDVARSVPAFRERAKALGIIDAQAARIAELEDLITAADSGIAAMQSRPVTRADKLSESPRDAAERAVFVVRGETLTHCNMLDLEVLKEMDAVPTRTLESVNPLDDWSGPARAELARREVKP